MGTTWDSIVGFIKGIFGGGGAPIQVGTDQQAASGSTTGSHSPIISARGDVNYGVNIVPDRDEANFRDVEEIMPDTLDMLAEVTRANPLFRDIVYLKKSTYAYNFPGGHINLADDTHPEIGAMLRILEGHHLVIDVKRDTFHYRLAERFAKYLRERGRSERA